MKRCADLVVIGAGSGGLQAAYEAAATFKRKVIVIDTQTVHGPPNYAALGGTCVNVGCVPKKLMIIGANYGEAMRDSAGFGYSAPKAQPNWQTLMKAKDAAVRNINESYMGMFRDVDGLDFVQGWGSFESAKTVVVRSGADRASPVVCTIDAENVLIATGSWPHVPRFEGSEHVISSNEAFYLSECPRRALVVGGGFIAVEFASIFNAYKPADGAVSIAYRGPLFLRGFDHVLREELATQLKANGIQVMFGENPVRIELTPDKARRVTFESGKVAEYDLVMYATGRKPRVDVLNLSAAGVALGAKGGVAVDEYNRTNVKGVYAIGDVTNRIMLTPVAIHEGNCAVQTMFAQPQKTDHAFVASAVFSIPPIGTVGMVEEDAAKKYDVVAVYQTSFLPLMHQLTGAAHKRVVVRIVADNSTGRVLGVHLLGAEMPEVIQAVAIAVRMGATVKQFFDTMCVHPTAAEEICAERTPDYFYVKGERKDKL